MARYIQTFIKNGDDMQVFTIYYCEHCGKEVPENWPKHYEGEDVYCGDCAFKVGLIDEKTFLKRFCYWMDIKGVRAVVHDGEVHVGTGRFPWEPVEKRNSNEYREWRKKVFERDGYKCQICEQVGGTLNAHHIKSYKDHPDLRLDVDNGITLCEKCHREVHKKGKEK